MIMISKIGGSHDTKNSEYDKYLILNINFTYFLIFSR